MKEPIRTAAVGVLPPNATTVELITGPGLREPLSLDERNTFLAVLPKLLTGKYPYIEWKNGAGQLQRLGGEIEIGSDGARR